MLSAADDEYLAELYRVIEDAPLEPTDPRYVALYDRAELGMPDPIAALARVARWSADDSVQLLLAPRGAGVSTELRRLRRDLITQGCVAAVVDPKNAPGATSITDASSFLACVARALIETLLREKVSTVPPPDAADLDARDAIGRCCAAMKLARGGDARVVLLVDSIERAVGADERATKVLETLFITQPEPLRLVGVHVVYAAPSWIKVRDTRLGARYDGVESITALRAHERTDGAPFAPGVRALEAVVEARPGVLRLLGDRARLAGVTVASGGCLGALLRLLRAVVKGATSVPVEEDVLRRVIDEERSALAPAGRDDAGRLTQLLQTRRPSLEDARELPEIARYLAANQVLVYRNGEEWYDVHPLLVPRLLATEGGLHLESLHIHGMRGIEQLDLDFAPRGDDGQWIVLLGENGVGKSTVLRAIAMALAEEAHVSAALATATAGFRRNPSEHATITLRANGRIYDAKVDAVGELEVVRQSQTGRPEARFLVAYGCQRGSALGGPERDLDFDPPHHIETLFNDTRAGLLHAESWLKNLRHAALDGSDPEAQHLLDAVIAALRAVLPDVDAIEVTPQRVWVVGARWGRCPLATLSDGYLTSAGWIIDLIARWIDAQHKAGRRVAANFCETMTGVVLLDEIDLHLHPRWQKDVIRMVRSCFPRMTFVVTTHNALTLHGARRGEIHVLRRTKEGSIEAKQVDLPPGIRAEDVLTGVWFGLTSTSDPETLELFERHQRMLREEAVAPGPTLQETEEELRRRLGRFADTSLERSALQVIARLRAVAPPDPTPEEREQLREEALRLLREEAIGGHGSAS